jgi:uncharacterized damage-inducible protein DinB
METAAFFKDLFMYNRARNTDLIDYLVQQQQPLPEKVLTLLSHTLNAHEIWNCRIVDSIPACSVWEMRALSEMQEADRKHFETSLEILASVDLSTEIAYSTSKGEPFSNSVRDILFHVINHSTYHRGQIMTALKEAGAGVLVTDYIFYKRAQPKL